MSADPRCYSLELKNTKDKLKLTNLNIDVVISGFLAKTAVTMTFFNDTDHDGVEGEVRSLKCAELPSLCCANPASSLHILARTNHTSFPSFCIFGYVVFL